MVPAHRLPRPTVMSPETASRAWKRSVRPPHVLFRGPAVSATAHAARSVRPPASPPAAPSEAREPPARPWCAGRQRREFYRTLYAGYVRLIPAVIRAGLSGIRLRLRHAPGHLLRAQWELLQSPGGGVQRQLLQLVRSTEPAVRRIRLRRVLQ